MSALPVGTRALAAFIDPEDQSVVLDFSHELVIAHPGGSAAEAATLTSILRTVALNFPATRSCVILVEGAQIETLAEGIIGPLKGTEFEVDSSLSDRQRKIILAGGTLNFIGKKTC